MILALDTATRFISLALHDGQAALAETTWQSRGMHTVELSPAAALLLQRAGTAPAGLKGVAVAIGPGSFTGLRIGLGFAKGICLAHGLPIFGVPTLDVLALAQPLRPEPMLAVLSAGRSRLAVGRYSNDGQRWIPDGPPEVKDWAAVIESLSGATYICGEIDARGAELLRKARGRAILAPPAVSLRRAGFLAELGWGRMREGDADDLDSLSPVYFGLGEASAA